VPDDPKMLIGGEWIDSASGFDVRGHQSIHGRGHRQVPEGGREDARRAIAAANAAWRDWASRSAFERGAAMRRMAEIVRKRRDDLAGTLSLDQGKPLRAEANDEVEELIAYFEMASADATRIDGLIPPSVDAGKRVLVYRVPRGVVGVISPWNWPYTMPDELLAPALAYGNAVVWVPAPSTSVCTAKLAECIQDAGLPPGVFNMVTGPGPVVGDEIATNRGTSRRAS
jgi:succinate-semialdehyde dehydrogenase/glutarate-semialdehyde dehydrogenase